jgi:hypothetical protein
LSGYVVEVDINHTLVQCMWQSRKIRLVESNLSPNYLVISFPSLFPSLSRVYISQRTTSSVRCSVSKSNLGQTNQELCIIRLDFSQNVAFSVFAAATSLLRQVDASLAGLEVCKRGIYIGSNYDWISTTAGKVR